MPKKIITPKDVNERTKIPAGGEMKITAARSKYFPFV
jgi:hypothetical protein